MWCQRLSAKQGQREERKRGTVSGRRAKMVRRRAACVKQGECVARPITPPAAMLEEQMAFTVRVGRWSTVPTSCIDETNRNSAAQWRELFSLRPPVRSAEGDSLHQVARTSPSENCRRATSALVHRPYGGPARSRKMRLALPYGGRPSQAQAGEPDSQASGRKATDAREAAGAHPQAVRGQAGQAARDVSLAQFVKIKYRADGSLL